VFQALDVFLDLNSSGNSSDLLLRYLHAGRTESGGSASLATRRATAEAVSKASYDGQLLDNVKMLWMVVAMSMTMASNVTRLLTPFE
jgi:hypothetical protein